MTKNEFKTRLFSIIQEEVPPPPAPTPPAPSPPASTKGGLAKRLFAMKNAGRAVSAIQSYAFLDLATGEGSLATALKSKFKDFGDAMTGRSALFGVGPFNPNKGAKRV